MDHSEFCQELKQIEISDGDHITDYEMSQARAVLGAIQWRVLQTAPHHASKLSWLQSALPHGSKDILHQVNKLCREVWAHRQLSVCTHRLGPLQELSFICWTDAAVGNRPDMSSTGGYLVGLVHSDMMKGSRGPVNPISWKSGRLPRVARSSLSAEIQSLSEGEQELMFCRAEWAELCGGTLDLLHPEHITCKIPAALVVDAKSVYDAVQKGDTASSAFSMKEKYAALELMAVTKNMRRQLTNLLWVSSEAELADGLTKASAQDSMRLFLLRGQEWNVKFDPLFVSAKKKRAASKSTEMIAEPSVLKPDLTWTELMSQHNETPSRKRLRGVL